MVPAGPQPPRWPLSGASTGCCCLASTHTPALPGGTTHEPRYRLGRLSSPESERLWITAKPVDGHLTARPSAARPSAAGDADLGAGRHREVVPGVQPAV